MINCVELKNFGPIEQLDWQNLGKINLVIGNNGCGKSYLLKALYSAMKTIEEYKRGDNPETDFDILWRKLYWTFQPKEKIGNLVTQSSNSDLFLGLSFKINYLQETAHFNYSFDKDATNVVKTFENSIGGLVSNSVFLPAKEVLSLYHFILKFKEQDKLFGFDDTYVDLAQALRWKNLVDSDRFIIELLNKLPSHLMTKANNPEFKDKFQEELIKYNLNKYPKHLINQLAQVQKLTKHIKKPSQVIENISNKNKSFENCSNFLENLIQGKMEYDESKERWYFKKGEQRFSMGETAEGVKKIAILDTLLENGYLSEDSIIFIDEPESNLHPTAISQLLDIIAILAEQGMQFFLASHSYFVIKKLFLIAQEKQMSIPVLSYQANEWVQSDLKEEMPDNPIIDESIALYEQEVDLAFK